jgi:hypothetical protein
MGRKLHITIAKGKTTKKNNNILNKNKKNIKIKK